MDNNIVTLSSVVLLTMLKLGKCSSNGAECSLPLGMESGKITDAQILVSSNVPNRTGCGHCARLNKNIKGWGAWCPDISKGSRNIKYDEFIQIDLLEVMKITKVATQGKELLNGIEFTKSYKITYSLDNSTWIFYKRNGICRNETFEGNKDVKTVVTSELNPPLLTRYIRIHPGYVQRNHVCLRLELYGCPGRTVHTQVGTVAEIPSRPKGSTCKEEIWSLPLITSVSVAALLAVAVLVLIGKLNRSKEQPCPKCKYESVQKIQTKLPEKGPESDRPEYVNSPTLESRVETTLELRSPTNLSQGDNGAARGVLSAEANHEMREHAMLDYHDYENNYDNESHAYDYPDSENNYENECAAYENMANKNNQVMKSTLGAGLQARTCSNTSSMNGYTDVAKMNDRTHRFDNERVGYETLDNRNNLLMKSLAARLQDTNSMTAGYTDVVKGQRCYENVYQ